MGFRCPRCHKEFGNNKQAFEDHLLLEPECGMVAELHITAIKIKTGKRKGKNLTKDPKPKKTKRTHSYIDPKHCFGKTSLVGDDDGWDDVQCSICGLKGKRRLSSYKFDKRISYKRIEKCGE